MNDAMGDAYKTIMKLEEGIIQLDQSLTLTSIAVSMKRIASALEQIAGNQSYNGDRIRAGVREVAAALEVANNR